jgi:Zn-dependent protease
MVTVHPLRPRRADRRVSPVFLGIVAVMAVSGWAVWQGIGSDPGFAVFLFCVATWIVSLCLHEYAHAVTALHSGDVTIGGKGYLTLNPMRYTEPTLSIVLPVIFVILGGIGLPGGAVFIERHRIRGRWRHSLISAAGPLVNVVFAFVLMLPFVVPGLLPSSTPAAFLDALAFLALLQTTAAVLNLLPVPGLDGYGIVQPWLPLSVRRQIEPFTPFGLLAVFGFLWIPKVNSAFFDLIDGITRAFGVPEFAASDGYGLFRFWT